MLSSKVFFSFTEVLDPTRHGDYNAWHQLDHRPENLALDGVHAGERWVRCPRCAQAGPAPDALLEGLHYLNAYWFREPAEPAVREWQALAERSLDQGRRPDLHWAERLLMGFFEQVQIAVSPRLPSSPEALPLRPTRGLYATVETLDEPRAPAAEARFRHEREWRVPRLLATPGVTGVAVLSSLSTTLDPPAEGARASRTLLLSPGALRGSTRVLLAFLDEDPHALAPTLAALDAEPTGRTRFRGALCAIQPWRWDWFDRVI
jgi:hypothetical protein